MEPNVKLYIKKIRFECVIECQIYHVNKCGTKCKIVDQGKIKFEYVIKCQIYYVNKCKTECDIVHQSKVRFECVIECQISNLLCK